MPIRRARDRELDRLREIEVDAGAAFADIGMAEIANDEPPSVESLAEYQADGRAWVHADDNDRPAAYLIAEEVDGTLHVAQISVDPMFAGRGLGRDLIDHAASWAAGRGFEALTLTTFVDVPWNGPYYQRLGFRPLGDHELTPGLARIRAQEAELGLDRWPRMAMIRRLSPRPST